MRAGTKPQPLADKIAAGRAAKILEARSCTRCAARSDDLGDAADLRGEDMPETSEYLRARQRDGKPWGADDLFIETWKWLKERGVRSS